MEDKLKIITKEANNALYFDDNSDYESALWKILEIASPKLYDWDDPDLKFIE